MTIHAYHGEILTPIDDPARGGEGAVVHHPSGLLVVENGVIVACGRYADLAWAHDGVPTTKLDGLIVPGFVDTHVHYPQVDRIASHGAQLLDWLDRHIFPAEIAFADRAHADEVAGFFLDELMRHGTTSALVYATVHKASVEALFDAALARNMRIVSGKVLMDRDAPEPLRDTLTSGRAESEALIATYRGRGRLGYAVTPRFALTSTEAQLAQVGEMVAAHPDVLMHTHLSENLGEIAAVAGCFPHARDYLDVYDRFGLVGGRSVFAHCIHLDDDAMARMGRAGASIAFCPTSNLFLGSGLFDLAKADAHGVKVGIGSDVGAGTSLSILHTLGEAYKVCQMRGMSLDPFRALYLATLGGARTLGLGDRIGALAPGYEADFIVLDAAATPLLARRTAATTTLHDRLFALQIMGDDRAIARTYVAGRLAHHRDMQS
jgi:guanine deaminase